MKNISLKLEEHIYSETEQIIKQLHKSRNRYINEALVFYNSVQNRKLLAEQLRQESALVSANSMEVLKELEGLEDEREAV